MTATALSEMFGLPHPIACISAPGARDSSAVERYFPHCDESFACLR